MGLEVFSVVPRKNHDTLLVILKEFPMTYICSFHKDGTPDMIADSLVRFGREEEVESLVSRWMEGEKLKPSEELSNKTKAE